MTPVVIGNKGTSTTTVSQPVMDDNGNMHFTVSNTALNGLSSLPGAPKDAIKTSLNFEVTNDGKVLLEGGKRTAYPSLEIYAYDSNGNVTLVILIQETKPGDLKNQDQDVPDQTPGGGQDHPRHPPYQQ